MSVIVTQTEPDITGQWLVEQTALMAQEQPHYRAHNPMHSTEAEATTQYTPLEMIEGVTAYMSHKALESDPHMNFLGESITDLLSNQKLTAKQHANLRKHIARQRGVGGGARISDDMLQRKNRVLLILAGLIEQTGIIMRRGPTGHLVENIQPISELAGQLRNLYDFTRQLGPNDLEHLVRIEREIESGVFENRVRNLVEGARVPIEAQAELERRRDVTQRDIVEAQRETNQTIGDEARAIRDHLARITGESDDLMSFSDGEAPDFMDFSDSDDDGPSPNQPSLVPEPAPAPSAGEAAEGQSSSISRPLALEDLEQGERPQRPSTPVIRRPTLEQSLASYAQRKGRALTQMEKTLLQKIYEERPDADDEGSQAGDDISPITAAFRKRTEEALDRATASNVPASPLDEKDEEYIRQMSDSMTSRAINRQERKYGRPLTAAEKQAIRDYQFVVGNFDMYRHKEKQKPGSSVDTGSEGDRTVKYPTDLTETFKNLTTRVINKNSPPLPLDVDTERYLMNEAASRTSQTVNRLEQFHGRPMTKEEKAAILDYNLATIYAHKYEELGKGKRSVTSGRGTGTILTEQEFKPRGTGSGTSNQNLLGTALAGLVNGNTNPHLITEILERLLVGVRDGSVSKARGRRIFNYVMQKKGKRSIEGSGTWGAPIPVNSPKRQRRVTFKDQAL